MLDQLESKEGEKRSAIRVVLDNFEFVDSGRAESVPTTAEAVSRDSNLQPKATDAPSPQQQNQSSHESDLDEDVPF